MRRDYYGVLGVARDAKPGQGRRRPTTGSCRKLHPTTQGADSEEAFKEELSVAYGHSDPEAPDVRYRLVPTLRGAVRLQVRAPASGGFSETSLKFMFRRQFQHASAADPASECAAAQDKLVTVGITSLEDAAFRCRQGSAPSRHPRPVRRLQQLNVSAGYLATQCSTCTARALCPRFQKFALRSLRAQTPTRRARDTAAIATPCAEECSGAGRVLRRTSLNINILAGAPGTRSRQRRG